MFIAVLFIVKSFSCVRLLATPWTIAYEAPPSMGFSRQEYWSGCHFLLQEIIANNCKHSKCQSIGD